MKYNFEWDSEKANANKKKHKVSFEIAATIFKDPGALTLFDDEHSESGENRWITLGLSENGNLLVIIHTFDQIDDNIARIRIISARKATKREKIQYQGD